MSYLHAHRIVHRDLKPSHVLLDEHFQAKISIDLTCVTTFDAHDYAMIGTLMYIAPEVMTGEYDHKVDVFSFGIFMYEVITVENLRETISPFAIYHGNRPRLPESLPPPYRELIERCWHQDPNERPEFCEIVQALAKLPELLQFVK